MRKALELTGKVFNKLTVICRDFEAEKNLKKKQSLWVVQCECGTVKTVKGCKLVYGDIQSCGCLISENLKERWKNNEEYREIMQKSHEKLIGVSRINSGSFKRGESPWNKGIPFLAISGDKNPNWKGGITPENIKIRTSIEYNNWVNSVYQRDGYICQKCKEKRSGNLNAHHILNFSKYPDLRTVLENGITFCEECHINFHKIYGKQDNNPEQVQKYLQGENE